jgi:hypothetical protein
MIFRRSYHVVFDENPGTGNFQSIENPHRGIIHDVPENVSVLQIVVTYGLCKNEQDIRLDLPEFILATYIFAIEVKTYRELMNLGIKDDLPETIRHKGAEYTEKFVATPHKPGYWLLPANARVQIAYPHMVETKRAEARGLKKSL